MFVGRQAYVYMDSFGLIRRSNNGNETSFNSTFANLARSYGVILREIAEIMSELREPNYRQDTAVLEASKMERLEVLRSCRAS